METMNTNAYKFHRLSLFVISVLCLWQLHVIAVADALSGAVLILNFDRASMSIQGGDPVEVDDQSGNGNHGLINGKGGEAVNVTPPEIVEGKYGEALRFSGQNWVEVLDSETLHITDALTMAAWVNPESIAGDQTICTKDRCYYMQLRSGKIGNYTQNLSTQGYHESSDVVPLEEWSHIAMSWDGSELVQYLNGEPVNSVNTSGQINITDDSIGIGAEVRIPSRGDNEWRFYTGTIDEVLVFNVSKTESEIAEIMAGQYLSVSMQDKLATTWGSLKK
jgi:hypothetical protein